MAREMHSIMDETYSKVADRILEVAASNALYRILVAIAGPPGSGKTTLAAQVVARINALVSNGGIRPAVAIAMDGFHYTRAHLDAMDDPVEAHKRRGAPFTFDVYGILELVHQLRSSTRVPAEQRAAISVPSFDHATKDPVPNGTTIPASASIVILEGNYLLLDEKPWNEIGPLLDCRIMVQVSAEEARARVALRHVQSGIEPTLELGQQRFDSNDAINGDLIRAKIGPCDLVVDSLHV